MADDPKPAEPKTLTYHLLSMLRRPIEYGLTGAALVGVLFLANRSEILPKVFKGAGFEVEFQEKVIRTTADTEQGIKVLRATVEEMRAELKSLRTALASIDAPVIADAPEPDAIAQTNALQKDADGADKDSLLVEQNQVIQTKGFMWLGTYDPQQERWTDFSIQLTDGADLPPPAQLSDQALMLTTTVNVREAYPSNDSSYFRSVRAIGVAETGTRATLLSVPQSYDRDGVEQIWAQVDVAARPYIGFSSSN